MKHKLFPLFNLLLVAGMLLSACGGAATAVVNEPIVEEPVVEENTAAEPAVVEEPEMVAITEGELDLAVADFLGSMEAYNTIGLDALNEMLIDNPPFLLDVRNASEAETSGHIPGSVLIPLRELPDNIGYLPAFDEPIVAYCGSGWRCTIALTLLETAGWQNVKGLKGGSFTGWADAGYEVTEGVEPEAAMLNAVDLDPAWTDWMIETLARVPENWGGIDSESLNTALVESPDLILIDARTTGEVTDNGYISADNWINIPLEEMVALKADWPTDKDAQIVVYCGSGHRSTIAMTILNGYGYTNVSSLKGGFGDWKGAGFPVEGAPASLDDAFNTFLADMEGYNTIALDALNEMMIDNAPFLLDVRNTSETESAGHIPGSVTIPLRELTENLAYLPGESETIVAYCGSGWRCTIGLTLLEMMGWDDVKGLKGGSFGGWVDAGYEVTEGLPPEPEALNAFTPDPALVTAATDALARIPEGWGVTTADALNTLLVENPDLIVIDVRTVDELASNGIIAADNWISIPLEDFINMKADWPADLNAKIVVYCGSGHRSTIAMTILYTYGYTDVGSLKDGFGGWVNAGFPVAEYVAP